jgi:hypothetical protein
MCPWQNHVLFNESALLQADWVEPVVGSYTVRVAASWLAAANGCGVCQFFACQQGAVQEFVNADY